MIVRTGCTLPAEDVSHGNVRDRDHAITMALPNIVIAAEMRSGGCSYSSTSTVMLRMKVMLRMRQCRSMPVYADLTLACPSCRSNKKAREVLLIIAGQLPTKGHTKR